MRCVIHTDDKGSAIVKLQDADGGWRDHDALEDIQVHAQVMRQRHLNQVGMEDQSGHLAGVLLRQPFYRVDRPRLHAAHGFAIGEAGPRWVFLHQPPHLAPPQVVDGFAFPIAIPHFAYVAAGFHFKLRVMAGNRFGRLHGARDGAGVNMLDGRRRQTPTERRRLSLPFFIEMHARRPAGKSAAFHEVIDRMADKQDGCHKPLARLIVRFIIT